ncbi:MAG: phage major capsid protein [Patescibacteria group bacterium]|nr:phage major capsid protein [Patescibacteria group bacterium]
MPRFAGVSAGSVVDNQNALIASTLPRLSKEVADNFFKDLPFFFWMRNKGRIKPWDSGESYEVPLMVAGNAYARAYEDYELLDVGPPDGFKNAVYMRAKYRVPIMYAATTLSANSGRAQIYNLIEKLKMQATKSLEKALNDDLLGASSTGTDPSNAGNANKLTSLFYMIEKAAYASQDSIIGGILKYDSEAQDYWVNQYTALVESSDLLSGLRANVIACTDGSDGPDLGLCDSESYQEIEDAVFDKRRFVNAEAANFGFSNVVYNGVTYMYDKKIPNEGGNASAEGTTFHINSDHLYIAVCTDRNFQVIPPEYDVNQDLYLGAVITHMQLICDNMKRQGVVDGTAYFA